MKKLVTITFLSILTFTHAQVPSYVPTNGLVGWWPFNGNANDESGNGNNGTVNGATLTADRNNILNSAYYFSSSACETRIDAIVNTNSIQTGLTISIWALRSGNGCIGPRLFEFWPGFDGPSQAQWGWDNSTTSISVGSTTSTGFQCYSMIPIPSDNTWIHLVYSNDGTIGRYYADGQIVSTVSSNGNPILAGNVSFGRMNHPAWDAFNGKLDDIGIWNRVLTECEIQDLYHAQVGFTTVDAGQDQSICRGTEVTLNGTGGNFLSWNNGVFNGVPFAPNQTSNYVLTGSDSLGCVGSDTVLVTVLDNASSTINQTAIDSYTLNGQTYTQSGTYTQVLTAANGCDSTITLNLELDFTGIQTNTLPSLKLYPNPVQDVLHIEGLTSKEFEYEVLSIDGKLLQKGKSQGEIAVKELRKGSYVLRVGQQQVSFVKQ